LYQDQDIAGLAVAAEKIQRQQLQPLETDKKAITPGDLIFEVEIDKEALYGQLPPGTEIEEILPLTPQQRHMLACLDEFGDRDPGLYLIQKLYLPRPANIDPARLEKVLAIVTAHRQLLRSVFLWKGLKEPLQVICKKGETPLIYKDWSHLSPARQEQELKELLREQWRQGYDRTRPTAFRMVLIKLAENNFQYFFTSDYIRFDGWSSGIIQFEVISCYIAVEMGQDINLIKEDQYKHYLGFLKNQDMKAAEDYWRGIFTGYRAKPSLIKRFRCNRQGMAAGFARQYIYYSPQTTHNIDLFLQRHRLVYASLVYAVWAMLLASYAHETDVVFGVIYSGRTIAAATGIESMVGNSINVLPIRMKIEPDKTILSWLKEIFHQQAQANHFEYTPLEKIKEWCGIPHQQPMFDSYIVMQNLPTPNLEDTIDNKEYVEMLKGRGMDKKVKGVGEIPQDRRHAHLFFAEMEYPLRVDIYMISQLCPVFNYFRHHLADSAVKSYMENMKVLLESIIENPYQTVEDLLNQINPGKYPEPENYDDIDFV
jgi:hypothetical protein